MTEGWFYGEWDTGPWWASSTPDMTPGNIE